MEIYTKYSFLDKSDHGIYYEFNRIIKDNFLNDCAYQHKNIIAFLNQNFTLTNVLWEEINNDNRERYYTEYHINDDRSPRLKSVVLDEYNVFDFKTNHIYTASDCKSKGLNPYVVQSSKLNILVNGSQFALGDLNNQIINDDKNFKFEFIVG